MARPKTFEREEILEKAMNLFWKQGYHATSIQELVDHLGINRASIYNSFGDKKEIFFQAFNHYKQKNFDAVQNLFEGQDSVKEGFQQLFAQAIKNNQKEEELKGCFVVNNITELANKDPEMLTLLTQNRSDMEDLFGRYLLEGQKTGEISIKQDAQNLASFLVTFYNGLKVIEKLHPSQESVEGMVASALSVLDP